MTPTEACIALNMLPTMGPVRLRKLLEVVETPDRVLTARRDALRAVERIRRKTPHWRKKFGAAMAQSSRNSQWRLSRTARLFQCGIESSADGARDCLSLKQDSTAALSSAFRKRSSRAARFMPCPAILTHR